MGTYVARRLVQAIPILLGITVITFGLAKLMPGDPFTTLLNPHVTAADLARMRQVHGLLDPLPIQYWNWLKAILTGNLGVSISFQEPVAELIRERVGPTFTLSFMSLLMTLVVSVPVGVYVAVRQYSLVDYALSIVTFMGIAMPTFFLGLLAIMLISIKLGWLPPSGVVTPGLHAPFPWNYGDVVKHLFLPALVLTFGSAAGLVRYVRSSMLEVIRQDFVRTGRAKGLDERSVLYRHALRNALIPVITILGLQVPYLFSGGIITEYVFVVPGIGLALYQGILARDYPVVMGITLFLSVLVVIGNLLADVLYALVDPRIRYD
ncbi:MAG: ABC transporter permease [Clostridia bacterium]|nr:ABC transporter permease [Clostridia bacterium]